MQYKIKNGVPELGSVVKNNGVNFGIFSRNGTKVILNIFNDENSSTPIFCYELDFIKNRTGDVWHIFIENLAPNLFYTWNIGGENSSNINNLFDINNHLIDPYARAFTQKNSDTFQKAIIINDNFLNREIIRPHISREKTVVYEMHVSLFTKSETSNILNNGSYKGILEKINHLKELGINTIELLPVFEFCDFVQNKNPITGKNLKNVWGYNPIGFFAPTTKYFSEEINTPESYEKNIKEFVNLVDTLHKNNFEVILDVVYNHTGEGDERGFVYNLKGMDNSIFYMFEENKYLNYSGTGNTLNTNHPVVKKMIIDSMTFWFSKIGVDGFRLDLGSILGRDENGQWLGSKNSLLNDIANDIILSKAKIFTEGWDAGGGYYLDDFPNNWSVWNGKFRDNVRSFIKSDVGIVGGIIQRVLGSPDIFPKDKSHLASLNFITAHDGFTMWDLVSYTEKNNIANGENNRDGESHNISWNCGFEGETENLDIIKLRKKQIKNFIILLMISRGIPMILMGDEICKTQKGNNNAYCQDSELNWLDWERGEKFQDIKTFFSRMIKFRLENNALTQKNINENDFDLTLHGVKPYLPDFNYLSHTIAFMFEIENENPIYVAFNFYFEPLEFELPRIFDRSWFLIINTEIENSFLEEKVLINSNKIILKPKSSIVTIAL